MFLLAVAIVRTPRTDFYSTHRLAGTELGHPMEAKMAADSPRVLRNWIWKQPQSVVLTGANFRQRAASGLERIVQLYHHDRGLSVKSLLRGKHFVPRRGRSWMLVEIDP